MKFDRKKDIFTIPNILTFIRICLVPVIVVLYLAYSDYLWAAITVCISGVTDVVDGFIARRFHMESDVGRVMDPIADKLTQLSVMMCLCFRYPLMIIPATVLVVKELISGLFGYYYVKLAKKALNSEWHGKLATVLLFIMMAVHLFWFDVIEIVSFILICAATAMLLISFVLYMFRYFRLFGALKDRPIEDPIVNLADAKIFDKSNKYGNTDVQEEQSKTDEKIDVEEIISVEKTEE